jgi:ribosome maturation factor RimP
MTDELRITQRIKVMAERILSGRDMELVDVQYRREGKKWILRLYIDRENGITIEDCASVSREISHHLDVEDLIHHRYMLEVSSPGINRPLVRENDYLKYRNSKIKLRTNDPIEGRKNFTGILSDFSNGMITLATDDKKTYHILLENVASARLDVDIKI